MNLAEFPITLLAERRGVSMITREVVVREERTGLNVIRRRSRSPAPSWTAFPRPRTTSSSSGSSTSRSERTTSPTAESGSPAPSSSAVLGWPDSGQSYRRIELSLKRWGQVFVLYENSWWEKPKQAYSTKGFGIIDDFELIDASKSRQQLAALSVEHRLERDLLPEPRGGVRPHPRPENPLPSPAPHLAADVSLPRQALLPLPCPDPRPPGPLPASMSASTGPTRTTGSSRRSSSRPSTSSRSSASSSP